MTNHKCECGRVWNVTEHKYFMRDKDSLDCKCGREIISWNGGVTYSAKLIEDLPKQA